uniref:K(+) efflux antiporter 6 n=2 Tax=Elaeis guineensis var. tenera TaxID=51953 RepID=A0A6I9RCU3_ELAGV|nr:K(+) efflux antiporter 6 [Elaeis guineensis]
MIDQALRKEFPESEQTDGETDPGGFYEKCCQGTLLETVARVSSKKNDTKEKLFQFHDVFNLDNENLAEDAPTLIDWKVKISCTAVRLEVCFIYPRFGCHSSAILA